MQPKELFFVIPTHRLREVGDTVKAYDDHFWRNGHSVPWWYSTTRAPPTSQRHLCPGEFPAGRDKKKLAHGLWRGKGLPRTHVNNKEK
jgi:hypothetical protein